LKKKIGLLKEEYTALFQTGRFFTTRLLFCRFIPAEQNKIGLIVAKKKVKRAIDRNTIKRIFREQFRKHNPHLPGMHILLSIRAPLKELHKPVWHEEADLCFAQLIKRSKDSR
jgi:ribonuclease P protein component